MADTELKPCPFCGNPKPELYQEKYQETLWLISCGGCRSRFTVVRKRRLVDGKSYTMDRGELLSNRDDVINAWNRRADNG